MTTPQIIHLCGEGWKLYDAWIAAFNHCPIIVADVQAAKQAYDQHRETCPNCTRSQEKDNAG